MVFGFLKSVVVTSVTFFFLIQNNFCHEMFLKTDRINHTMLNCMFNHTETPNNAGGRRKILTVPCCTTILFSFVLTQDANFLSLRKSALKTIVTGLFVTPASAMLPFKTINTDALFKLVVVLVG